jgi:hypothetical protein
LKQSQGPLFGPAALALTRGDGHGAACGACLEAFPWPDQVGQVRGGAGRCRGFAADRRLEWAQAPGCATSSVSWWRIGWTEGIPGTTCLEEQRPRSPGPARTPRQCARSPAKRSRRQQALYLKSPQTG